MAPLCCFSLKKVWMIYELYPNRPNTQNYHKVRVILITTLGPKQFVWIVPNRFRQRRLQKLQSNGFNSKSWYCCILCLTERNLSIFVVLFMITELSTYTAFHYSLHFLYFDIEFPMILHVALLHTKQLRIDRNI